MVSLIAAYKPAQEATQITPREAMTTIGSTRAKTQPGRHFLLMVFLDLHHLACG